MKVDREQDRPGKGAARETQAFLWDTAVTGLGVRILPTGDEGNKR
jgi:hypothetical protein